MALLSEAIPADGRARGLLDVRSAGLIKLPLNLTGDPELVRTWAGDRATVRAEGLFWRIFPRRELKRFVRNGIMVGVAVAELVQEDGHAYPRMHTLDPRFLSYRRDEDAWYYLSSTGPQRITAGDGRWILWFPEGDYRPWMEGAWRAMASPWIQKKIAVLDRARYGHRQAEGARIGTAPKKSTQRQRDDFLEKIKRATREAIYVLPEGWGLKHEEMSSSRAFAVYSDTIKWADDEMTFALNGNMVTSDGATGFLSEGSIFERVALGLIQSNAETLAEAIRTQGIGPVLYYCFGRDPAEAPVVAWDTTPPVDRKDRAAVVGTLGDSIQKADAALKPHGLRTKAQVLASEFGVPVEPLPSQVVTLAAIRAARRAKAAAAEISMRRAA